MLKIEPFEKYPSKYENWFKKNKFAYKSELLAIKKVLPNDNKSIEIGVGSARFASPLGIKIGIDPSKEMLKIAQKRDILIINAVAENLPLREDTFSFALMVTTICFVENLISAFHEAYRIIRHKGSLIVSFIDKNSSVGKSYQKRKYKSKFYKVATFYSVKEVLSNLKKAGFMFFEFYQTIFRSLRELDKIEPVKEGYDQGSFVVIKARK
jgi:ubiquinone/menaquinone biosynthesis C-methylase UbiE